MSSVNWFVSPQFGQRVVSVTVATDDFLDVESDFTKRHRPALPLNLGQFTRGLLFVLSRPAAQCKKHHAKADVHHPNRHIEPALASDQRSDAPEQSCHEEADCCNLKSTRLPWSHGHCLPWV
jgi:hypothetical protein